MAPKRVDENSNYGVDRKAKIAAREAKDGGLYTRFVEIGRVVLIQFGACPGGKDRRAPHNAATQAAAAAATAAAGGGGAGAVKGSDRVRRRSARGRRRGRTRSRAPTIRS